MNSSDIQAQDISACVARKKASSSKAELGSVIGTGTVDGAALADLLQRAVEKTRDGLNISSGLLTEHLKQDVKEELNDCSGKRYFQSVNPGFCEFPDDLYHD